MNNQYFINKIPELNISIAKQTSITILIIVLISIVCKSLQPLIDYKIIALILFFLVSIYALIFDIIPVFISASLCAAVLNYFFIEPLYTFNIKSLDDIILFVVFYIIVMMNIFLTSRIRHAKNIIKEKTENEKAIKLYNTIFNSLSHELRTPLATIMSSVDTLTSTQTNLTKEQIELILDHIKIAGNRLNLQVENLLNMSRLESGLIQPKPIWCDINEVIFNIINIVENSSGQKINFEINENLPLCYFDPGIFSQIVQNIINNSIHHNLNSIEINIEINVIEDKNLFISIKDSGKGVKNEDLKQLFNKFYRVSKETTGGTGLGLSIVKGYTEALNGFVFAKQNHPTGLIIEITIPIETSYINKLNNE